MAVKNIIYPIPMITINSTTFTGFYQIFTIGGLPQACALVKIVNRSTVDVKISLDGITDHDIVPSDSIVVYDFQSNHQVESETSLISKGQEIYIEGSAGTGNVYLVGWFQPTTM
jgi:hypothetical protein